MKYLASFAILCFIAIAVFGYAGLVTHDSAFMHCAKALAGSRGVCPNAVDMGNLHVRIYQSFSLSLLAAAAGLLLAIFGILLGKLELRTEKFNFAFEPDKFSNVQQRIYSWLVLHQHSDPLV